METVGFYHKVRQYQDTSLISAVPQYESRAVLSPSAALAQTPQNPIVNAPPIIDQILEKLGIRSIDDLTLVEKATYSNGHRRRRLGSTTASRR